MIGNRVYTKAIKMKDTLSSFQNSDGFSIESLNSKINWSASNEIYNSPQNTGSSCQLTSLCLCCMKCEKDNKSLLYSLSNRSNKYLLQKEQPIMKTTVIKTQMIAKPLKQLKLFSLRTILSGIMILKTIMNIVFLLTQVSVADDSHINYIKNVNILLTYAIDIPIYRMNTKTVTI